MSETKNTISPEIIESFLSGSHEQKYIVAIESEYSTPTVHLVINDPEKGKYVEPDTYKPFLWCKHDVTTMIYEGKRTKIIEMCGKYGIKFKALRTADDNGHSPERMLNGYKYLVTCKKSYNDLINFFKEGGVDVFKPEFSKSFVMFSPTEQYLIQTGKRLFKGIDDYDGLHRFQFDLETEGLFASKHAIFQFGVRDNRNIEYVLEVLGDTPAERRNAERDAIQKFFQIIDIIQPDLITGYNSENFDWAFIFERAERLGMDVTDLAITLNRFSKIKRKPSTLKLGGETENYLQTHMWGYNIVDISHAVRRAMAINSEIKSWGLKYITQYSGIAKPNRVYVPGDKINSTWRDTENDYAFNNENGDWYKISEKYPLKDGYKIVKGNYIVQRYLQDDLWETEQVDNLYNQASFLIAKMLPTTFMRSSTMGTAGQWKLIMAAWSYENGLAIPETQKKQDFTGGLSRLLEVGYARNVVKLDFAALYPKTQLTHNIFPELDITGVMKGMLTYVVDTRDKFKFLTGDEKKKAKKLEKLIKPDPKTMTPEEIAEIEARVAAMNKEELDEIKKKIAEHKALANLYDKKQLPLKILANSWFGSYGAPYIFNWGDVDSAEETTCRGRQYLRLMVRHFTEKHGFKALVGDSVTYDTPVYVRNKINNTIDIVPICDLFNENSKFLDGDKLRDYEEKNYEVLTRNGWRNIKYVYRHETDKKIHRITTKDRLLNVTEDHSLFQNGFEVKPSSLNRGDVIDTYEIPFNTNNNIVLSEDEAFLYGFFMGDGSAINNKRKVRYKSKKNGEIKTYLVKRSDWKISNSRVELLERLQTILKNRFNKNGLIKNHLKSSGVYNLVVHDASFTDFFCENFYTSYREKKVPKTILNANKLVKKAFIEGVFASDGYGDNIENCSDIGMKTQIGMAGIGLLLKELGIEFKIKVRNDKQNFISFSLKNSNRDNSSFTSKTIKKTNEVWKNDIILNRDKNKYVYDISTEDGTFVCGINGIIAHNTDGFNFAFPDNIDSIKYVAKGNHWKTEGLGGQELIGLDAVLAEFNENYMEGRMGLDIDDVCSSTINFARKNYANDIDGKIKLVGNSVKSKKMSVYIEEFLGKGIRMLLDGDGHSFINFYYEYVDKIYNFQIPLVKIATKAKVKATIAEYKKKSLLKNKKGNPLPKQAHMELAIKDGLEVNLGDVLYYINTGTAKSHGDIKSEKNKATGTIVTNINCKLIKPEVVERDFEAIKELEMLTKTVAKLKTEEVVDEENIASLEARIEAIHEELFTDEYNVARYLDAFNKKVKPLLVCFSPEIRDKILLDIVKVKDETTKKKVERLKDRVFFTKAECGLVSGMPFKKTDQDTYEELMTMEDKEIRFWDRVNKVPNNMEVEEWETIRADYHERMRIAREEGIKFEQNKLDEIFRRLEIEELDKMVTNLEVPIDVFIIADVSNDGTYKLVSRKWSEPLCDLMDIFKYSAEAKERNKFYLENNYVDRDRDVKYQLWLDYLNERKLLTGETITSIVVEQPYEVSTEIKIGEETQEKLKEKANNLYIPKEDTSKTKKNLGGEDEDEEGDDDGELTEEDIKKIRSEDEDLKLDDEVDDTFGEIPDGYIIGTPIAEEKKEDDGWLF